MNSKIKIVPESVRMQSSDFFQKNSTILPTLRFAHTHVFCHNFNCSFVTILTVYHFNHLNQIIFKTLSIILNLVNSTYFILPYLKNTNIPFHTSFYRFLHFIILKSNICIKYLRGDVGIMVVTKTGQSFICLPGKCLADCYT